MTGEPRIIYLDNNDSLVCHVNDMHGPWTHVRVDGRLVAREKVTLLGDSVRVLVPDFQWEEYAEPTLVYGEMEYGEYVLKGEVEIIAAVSSVSFAKVYEGPGVYAERDAEWGRDAERMVGK